MSDQLKESVRTASAVPSLWRRAPWWRATVVAAGVLTIAALAFRAEQSPVMPTPKAIPQAAAQTQPPVAVAVPAPAPILPSTPAPAAAPISPPDTPRAAGLSASEEEEQTLAACHPHLTGNPNSMPQIDVASTPQPNLQHIKLNLWVNGAGVVTNEALTDATLGTPAEREAEMQYAKGLTFSLPNTKECRSRQVEVIGEVFESRDASGKWASYMKLRPKVFFNASGVLQHGD